MTEWKIETLPAFEDAFKAIKDTRIQRQIIERIKQLRQDPLSLSKPLTGELKNCRSMRAVGQRFRVIFSVDASSKTISLLLVGIRKEGAKGDVYRLAQKLLSTKRF